jgi:DNA polymerase I-like protein with 3'-5' exonuclease and polymerase domains
VVRVRDEAGVEELIKFLEENKEFGFDIETTPVKDFYWRRIRTFQFGNSKVQYVIDLKDFVYSDELHDCQGEYGKHLHKYPYISSLLKKLEPFLASDKYLKVGVNLGFEYMCLYWSFGIRSFGFYDCMLAEKCIWAGMPGKASLKNYEFYSMEEMFLRYKNMTIDKSLQTSFNLDDKISDEQYEYAALDTRIPLGIKAYQDLIANGETGETLRKNGYYAVADSLSYMPDILFGDNLNEIIAIENGAIGSFIDMHLHGENIDTAKWGARVNKAIIEFNTLITDLDAFFLPIVGSKNEAIDDTEIDKLEIEWKALREETVKEKNLKLQISAAKKWIKQNPEKFDGVESKNNAIKSFELIKEEMQEERLAKKEEIKKKCSELKKKRTKIKNLAKDCEGEALINYSSDAQVMACLRANVKKLSKLESMDDDTLEGYKSIPVIAMMQKYHGLSKEIGTYGMAWCSKWTTHPCKEEGWLHPGDGKLHCEFNQYDAETGRSSSSKPNGQNLPQDKEVRSSFVADPPNEDIRISDCCEADVFTNPGDAWPDKCGKCGEYCNTHAEEYVLVTGDMSGAELRIIAEDSQDEQWIGAFERGEDLHSSGTELLYEVEWKNEALPDCLYYVLHDEVSVAKYPKATIGTPKKEKCKCPLHKERRDGTKACNFLLAYGGGPGTLATNIKKTFKEAKALMALHEQKNPGIWKYLDESGKKAAIMHKSFDLFGRRRVLPEPTFEDAKENCKEYREKELRLPEEQATININTFIVAKGRKPLLEEEWYLTHREPTPNEIGKSYYQMTNGIGRKGKNMRIQGTNATIAKLAMSSLVDKDGIPYLWHTLPKFRARLVKFVHDEFVVHCPKRYAEQVAALIGDAFKRAAATKMKRVIMEFDYNVATYWKK